MTQGLGELKTVSNVLRNHRFETKELIVGWVTVDGKLVQLAFTRHELQRPEERAEDNTEDLPALGPRPPSQEYVDKLAADNDRLEAKLGAIRNRGFFARLFNTGW